MAFADDETSIQDGAPRELYSFFGTYNNYFVTSFSKQLTNLDAVFETGYAVKRSSLEEGTQEDEDISLTVEMSIDHPLVVEYVLSGLPPPGLSLVLERAHPNDLNSTVTFFVGEVVSFSIENKICKMKVPSLFSFLFDGPLPRPKYQAPCNHVLGDERCGVDMSAPENSQDTTIVSINGTTIVVAANTFVDGDTDAGKMIVGGERRQITGNTGTTFTISSPFSAGVQALDPVTIRRGCDHALNGDCINRYANAINFGGFPLVPDRNPFNSRL